MDFKLHLGELSHNAKVTVPKEVPVTFGFSGELAGKAHFTAKDGAIFAKLELTEKANLELMGLAPAGEVEYNAAGKISKFDLKEVSLVLKQ